MFNFSKGLSSILVWGRGAVPEIVADGTCNGGPGEIPEGYHNSNPRAPSIGHSANSGVSGLQSTDAQYADWHAY